MCVDVCKVDVLRQTDVLAKGWQKAHAGQKNVLTMTTVRRMTHDGVVAYAHTREL